VVKLSHTRDQPCCRVLDELEPLDETVTDARQQAVAVVDAPTNKGVDECFRRCRR